MTKLKNQIRIVVTLVFLSLILPASSNPCYSHEGCGCSLSQVTGNSLCVTDILTKTLPYLTPAFAAMSAALYSAWDGVCQFLIGSSYTLAISGEKTQQDFSSYDQHEQEGMCFSNSTIATSLQADFAGDDLATKLLK